MQCKERLEAYLRENKVPFQARYHALAYTAQEVAASEHIPGRMLTKVVIVMADGKMTMLVLPAPCLVDLEKVAVVLGAKQVRLAREDEFSAVFPDCEVGAMPPLGNLYGLPVYVERILTEDEIIVFQAGTHSDAISMRYAHFERLVRPTVADIARRPSSAGVAVRQVERRQATRRGRLAVDLPVAYQKALEMTKRALAAEDFGVLAEIDVRRILKEKTGVDFRHYTILGACNPSLAYMGLQRHLELGLLLPCNVIVYEEGEGSVVAIQDPEEILMVAKDPSLGDVARIARGRLEKVIEALAASKG